MRKSLALPAPLSLHPHRGRCWEGDHLNVSREPAHRRQRLHIIKHICEHGLAHFVAFQQYILKQHVFLFTRVVLKSSVYCGAVTVWRLGLEVRGFLLLTKLSKCFGTFILELSL